MKAGREVYLDAFDAEWNQTAKTGSKERACEAWERLGRPTFGLSWKRWEACAEWRADWYHYPHVATWLNDGRHRQNPAETRPKVVSSNPRAAAAEREHEDREVERLFGVSR